MSLQSEVQEALQAESVNVQHWSSYSAQRSAIVRPGGFIEGREVVEVWAVNLKPSNLPRSDPDYGLADFAATIYAVLRRMMLDVSGTPGPDYAPSGSEPRRTIVFTGSGLAVVSLGD